RSTRLNMPYNHKICQELFGIDGVSDADTDRFNAIYYQPLLAPPASQMMFINGSIDPWITASIAKFDGNDVNPDLAYATISGGSHCSDFASAKPTDNADLKQARSTLSTLISQWVQ